MTNQANEGETSSPPPEIEQIEPAESGTAGEQAAGEVTGPPAIIEDQPPGNSEIGQFSWTSAAEELDYIRSQAGMRLLREGLRSLEAGRAEAVEQLNEARSALQGCNDDKSKALSRVAVLEERLARYGDAIRTERGSITLGALLVGGAATHLNGDDWIFPSLLVGIGLLLVVLGWFVSPIGREDDQ